MKILSGLGVLYKTFNGINNHVNPQGIGPMNTPLDLILSLFPDLLRCEYYPLSPCHNPIFTPRIFSGVGMKNEAARTEPG